MSSSNLVGRDDVYTLPPQSLLIAHATMASLGFTVLLPIGAIVARYRAVNPFWFKLHYFMQCFSGLIIIPGVACGLKFSDRISPVDFTHSKHNNVGIALLVLYLGQVVVGLLIHYVKIPKHTTYRRPQNYLHAILGLIIIGLGFWQVRNGYKEQWPVWGLKVLPSGVDKAWIAVLVIMVVLYVVGLALLPKQYKGEAEDRRREQPVKA